MGNRASTVPRFKANTSGTQLKSFPGNTISSGVSMQSPIHYPDSALQTLSQLEPYTDRVQAPDPLASESTLESNDDPTVCRLHCD
jgi:hypothetical protein